MDSDSSRAEFGRMLAAGERSQKIGQCSRTGRLDRARSRISALQGESLSALFV
jgi:hypothetical protein